VKHSANGARPQTRQILVNRWFDRFVAAELYDKDQYHQFCKQVKHKTDLQIEQIFRTECRQMGIQHMMFYETERKTK
jgi:hypothetical protein